MNVLARFNPAWQIARQLFNEGLDRIRTNDPQATHSVSGDNNLSAVRQDRVAAVQPPMPITNGDGYAKHDEEAGGVWGRSSVQTDQAAKVKPFVASRFSDGFDAYVKPMVNLSGGLQAASVLQTASYAAPQASPNAFVASLSDLPRMA